MPPRELLTVDTTYLYALDNVGSSAYGDATRLLTLARRGDVELAIAPQGHRTDMKPHPLGSVARLAGTLIGPGVIALPQLAILSDVTYPAETLFPGAFVAGFDDAWLAIASKWSGPGRLPQGADMLHAHTHVHGRRDVLVTDDLGLRTMCERLRLEHAIAIVAESLADCVARLDS